LIVLENSESFCKVLFFCISTVCIAVTATTVVRVYSGELIVSQEKEAGCAAVILKVGAKKMAQPSLSGMWATPDSRKKRGKCS